MNREAVKVRAQTTFIRGRAWARTLLTAVGIGLVLLGAWNMLAVPLVEMEPFAPSRGFGLKPVGSGSGAYYIGDALLIFAGVVIAWLS